MRQDQELYIVIIIGIILGFLLVGFIIGMLFLHKRRQERQEQEMVRIKETFEREVLRSQLEIQENTFKTISQELHDNIGQMLSVVKLSLSALPIEKEHPARDLVVHSQQVLNKAIVDLSDLTKSLHTDRIADVGLAESIKYALQSVKNAGLLKVNFSMKGEEQPLPEQKGIFLYRMFQEMLNNILKHAEAKQVSVNLNYMEGDGFLMTIADDGKGFNVTEKKQTTSSGKGVGLKSMVNRASLIGAGINIDSTPGNGTTISVELKSTAE